MTGRASTMKERPIIFSAPMVRAILAETKTQTRRLVRNVAEDAHTFSRCDADGSWIIWCSAAGPGGGDYHAFTQRAYPNGGGSRCPYGVPGDRLWVRETFSRADPCLLGGRPQPVTFYCADNNRPTWAETRWRPAIYMPRTLSRITLELTAVRVQRLQEITEEDARAEGVEPFFQQFPNIGREQRLTSGELAADAEHRAAYAVGWDDINGERALWSSNPWVWALTFRRVEAS